MKLSDVLILGVAAAFVVVGIYEIVVLGPARAYWSIMIALALFFVYAIRKRQ